MTIRSKAQALQGYLAYEKPPHPEDPTVGLCLGPYGGPRGDDDFLSEIVHLAFSRRGSSMDYVGGVDSYTAFALC